MTLSPRPAARGRTVAAAALLAALAGSGAGHAATPSFDQVKWFQIRFCEEIKYLKVDAPSGPVGVMPAFGLAVDPFKEEGVIHAYHWDLLSGQTVDQTDLKVAPDFLRVALRMAVPSKDGGRVLIANSSHEVLLYDLASRQIVQRFSGHRNGTDFVGFSASERLVVAIANDQQVWLWDVGGDPATPVQVIQVPEWAARAEFIDSDTKLRVFGESTTFVYDVATGRLVDTHALTSKITVDRMHRPETAALAPDGLSYAAQADGLDTGGIGLYRRDTSAALWRHDLGRITPPADSDFPSMANDPTGYAFSPRGECLVVGAWGVYRVLDPATGQLLFEQRVNAAGYYLAFSPDGHYLIDSGGCDVQVYRVPAVCDRSSH